MRIDGGFYVFELGSSDVDKMLKMMDRHVV